MRVWKISALFFISGKGFPKSLYHKIKREQLNYSLSMDYYYHFTCFLAKEYHIK